MLLPAIPQSVLNLGEGLQIAPGDGKCQSIHGSVAQNDKAVFIKEANAAGQIVNSLFDAALQMAQSFHSISPSFSTKQDNNHSPSPSS